MIEPSKYEVQDARRRLQDRKNKAGGILRIQHFPHKSNSLEWVCPEAIVAVIRQKGKTNGTQIALQKKRNVGAIIPIEDVVS